jgi:alpha-glucoside transport system permease protein
MPDGAETRVPAEERTEAATAGGAAAPAAPPETRRKRRLRLRKFGTLALFLTPTLIVLGAWVAYPIVYSLFRSLYDEVGAKFVGLENYQSIFTNPQTFTAVRNNIIWVLVAPAVVTALGLVFAVMTERIRWATAFKVAVFMPMAISFLATGVIWRLVYDEDPSKGLANAFLRGAAGIVQEPGHYAGAEPRDPEALPAEGQAFASADSVSPGDSATLGFISFSPDDLPAGAGNAAEPPDAGSGEITGTVWLDLTLGGGGTEGQIDPSERAMPEMTVEAVRGDEVVGTATSASDGTFAISGLDPGSYTLRLPETNFRPPFGGVGWLGPALVTPSIIVAYIWMWAGFAMVVIGAGLAAIPRDVLEAARVDGAGEWQVFRRVTVPLLAPVLAVVLVTLAINVLKIFDLVLVMTSGTASVNEADVIALRMWKTAFGGARDFGLGSALAVFLFLLVIPAMAFNIRRFRQENA